MRARILFVAIFAALGGCGGSGSDAPSCSDGLKNGAETAVDCGGGCGPCPDGSGCGLPRDCASRVCTGSICAAPTCGDGVMNGDESSDDCGGSTCPGCPPGLMCRTDADCATGWCNPAAPPVKSCDCGEPDAIYVSAAGDDANRGSRSSPLRSPQAAVACSQVRTRPIRVAEGVYPSEVVWTVSLVDGMSLLGGYSPDFTARDWAVHVSTIRDVTDLSTNPYGWTAAVHVSSTSPDTVLEGFTVEGVTTGAVIEALTISVAGSATIRGNVIQCGGSPDATNARCIDVTTAGATPVITGNTIHLGVAQSTAWGVYALTTIPPAVAGNTIDGGAATTVIGIDLGNVAQAGGAIRANLIQLGAGAGTSYGLVVDGSAPVLVEANELRLAASAAVGLRVQAGASMLRNNLLVMSGAGTAIEDGSGSEISNNTIVGTSGTGILAKVSGSAIRNNAFDQAGGICIAEEGLTADPSSIRNNDLFGCPILYRDEGTGYLVALVDVNGLPGAAANLVGDPQFVPTTYHPGASSPLLGAAEDLSTLFDTDKSGAARTVPWTIGAYEQ